MSGADFRPSYLNRQVTAKNGHESERDRAILATHLVRRYEPVERRCLRCHSEFLSTGPHHRMCNPCRNDPEREIY